MLMGEAAADRRGFLGFCTGALMTVLGLVLAVPALGYAFAPLRRRRGVRDSEAAFEDLGPVGGIPAGEWRLLPLEFVHQDGWEKVRVRHSVWVRREGKSVERVLALSPICPHLGCPINWYRDRSEFICPCHGGVFDAEGRHIAGPPPRSMDPLEFEIRDGRLWVRWQDFKIGTSQRIAVST